MKNKDHLSISWLPRVPVVRIRITKKNSLFVSWLSLSVSLFYVRGGEGGVFAHGNRVGVANRSVLVHSGLVCRS